MSIFSNTRTNVYSISQIGFDKFLLFSGEMGSFIEWNFFELSSWAIDQRVQIFKCFVALGLSLFNDVIQNVLAEPVLTGTSLFIAKSTNAAHWVFATIFCFWCFVMFLWLSLGLDVEGFIGEIKVLVSIFSVVPGNWHHFVLHFEIYFLLFL